jgi:hypothetical protein
MVPAAPAAALVEQAHAAAATTTRPVAGAVAKVVVAAATTLPVAWVAAEGPAVAARMPAAGESGERELAVAVPTATVVWLDAACSMWTLACSSSLTGSSPSRRRSSPHASGHLAGGRGRGEEEGPTSRLGGSTRRRPEVSRVARPPSPRSMGVDPQEQPQLAPHLTRVNYMFLHAFRLTSVTSRRFLLTDVTLPITV